VSSEQEKSVTITERVYEKIRTAIVEGEIAAGSKLSEPDLARRYGISRGPLREAIRQLQAGNLVELKANVGARVVALTPQQLLEIYSVREALEGMAARLAAENMPREEIAELRRMLDDQRLRLEQDGGSVDLQKEGDLDFHYRIVKGSRNRLLVRLLCNDLYHAVRMYRCQFGMSGRRIRPAFSEHQFIVDAIEGRDGEQAEILMRFHIRASRRNVERQLKDYEN